MNPIEERIAKAISELMSDEEVLSASLAESIAERCHIKGLTAAHVLDGKAPKAIAALWLRERLLVKPAIRTAASQDKPYPLLPFSQIVFNSIKAGNEQAWTFPFTLRMKSEYADAEKLRHAIEIAIDAHPVLSMRIDGDGMQHYEMGYRTPYLAYSITEREEWIYLEMVVNRILGDATSFVVFMHDVFKVYEGKTIAHDAYLEYLQEYQEHTLSKDYAKHKNALNHQFDDIECSARPCSENHDDWGVLGVLQVEIPVTTTPILTLAVAEAMMDYNHENEAVLTWAYMGRETREQQSIFGSLHRDIPLLFRRSDGTASQRLAMAKKILEQGIVNSDYPYTALSNIRDYWTKAVNVLVQPKIESMFEDCPIPFEIVMPEGTVPAYCMLDIEMTEGDNHITIKYSSSHYSESDMCRFGGMIAEKIKEIKA